MTGVVWCVLNGGASGVSGFPLNQLWSLVQNPLRSNARRRPLRLRRFCHYWKVPMCRPGFYYVQQLYASALPKGLNSFSAWAKRQEYVGSMTSPRFECRRISFSKDSFKKGWFEGHSQQICWTLEQSHELKQCCKGYCFGRQQGFFMTATHGFS